MKYNKSKFAEDYKKWRQERYALFNRKIDEHADHPKYAWLRKYADEAMLFNEGAGYLMIKGEDFIKRIEQAPSQVIADWLDGKNELEWYLIRAFGEDECKKASVEEIISDAAARTEQPEADEQRKEDFEK